jgi:hypothetical protein
MKNLRLHTEQLEQPIDIGGNIAVCKSEGGTSSI